MTPQARLDAIQERLDRAHHRVTTITQEHQQISEREAHQQAGTEQPENTEQENQ